MKTAVSLPAEVFLAAEQLAHGRGLSRNALSTQDIKADLAQHQIDPLTEPIDRVADTVETRLEPGLERFQRETPKRHG